MTICRFARGSYRARLTLIAGASLAALAACGGSGDDDSPPVPSAKYSAEIRRTEMGIPHIKAANWGSLGYGSGYAQAQDVLCTIADSMLTYRGERSRYFGGQAQAVYNSTLAMPRNIDSDFYFKHVLTDEAVARMMSAQPDKLLRMMEGYAAGYNRYVAEVKSGESKANAACSGEPWVKAITVQDLWRRVYSANLAAGYSNFLPAIANAVPPQPKAKMGAEASPVQPSSPSAIAPGTMSIPALQVGGPNGVGSNMYGFGTQGTGTDSPLMFGNPHWYWKGPDRFYQAQLTIDGEVNVSGVSFLGIPLTQIGFNNDIAWSHTVSTARRFGFFMLTLDPTDPTRYMLDGKSTPLQSHEVSVDVRGTDGAISQVKRTLYQSSYGPIVNLSNLHPAMGWTAQSAIALRDINADNFRTLKNWMRWAQAKSLTEFVQIQREEAAIPWVNTVAVGRGNAHAWYADIGTVPNAPPTLLTGCSTPFSAAAAVALPGVPVLDGSRSACDWQRDADSVQAGAIGPSRLPSLLRADYVANMNDSYWLTNPTQPMTGYPSIVGPTGTPQSLRTRLGHTMALQRLAGTDGYPGNTATSEIVRQMVLDSRVQSAYLKDQVIALLCGAAQAPTGSERAAGCAALSGWDGRGTKVSRGSHLWDEFWSALSALKVPAAKLYQVPFDPADPLNTPRDLNSAAAAEVGQAFDTAIAKIKANGFALDAMRGDLLYVTRGADRLPLFGGCGDVGYFTYVCPQAPLSPAGYAMDGQPHGNSYMQVVTFPQGRVDAHTFLTFSLSDDPASPHYGDYTRRFSDQQWLKVPFSETEIAASAALVRTTIKE